MYIYITQHTHFETFENFNPLQPFFQEDYPSQRFRPQKRELNEEQQSDVYDPYYSPPETFMPSQSSDATGHQLLSYARLAFFSFFGVHPQQYQNPGVGAPPGPQWNVQSRPASVLHGGQVRHKMAPYLTGQNDSRKHLSTRER